MKVAIESLTERLAAANARAEAGKDGSRVTVRTDYLADALTMIAMLNREVEAAKTPPPAVVIERSTFALIHDAASGGVTAGIAVVIALTGYGIGFLTHFGH